MKQGLAERNMIAAGRVLHYQSMPTWIVSNTEQGIRVSGMSEDSIDFLDFGQGISGDDLARLRMDEYQIVKDIGEQRGLWSEVKEGAHNVRSAA